MKNQPFKGYWYNLVKSDCEKNGMLLDEKVIKDTDKDTLKKLI